MRGLFFRKGVTMLDSAIHLSQTLMLALIAGWLTTGVLDNLLYPEQNEQFTTQVLTMSRLRAEFPDFYDQIGHRAVSNRRHQIIMFRFVVWVEILVAVLLWIGVLMMATSCLSWVAADTARSTAILGATGFVTIWAGFLIVGNHFAYWFGHEAAQNTHYQMTLWGIGVLIFLSLT